MEDKKIYELELKPNNTCTPETCAICGGYCEPQIPLDVFLRDSYCPVCDDCINAHAPDLHKLRKVFYSSNDNLNLYMEYEPRQDASSHNKIDIINIDADVQKYKDSLKKYEHTAIVRLGNKHIVVKANNLTYADFSGYLNHKYDQRNWVYISLDGEYVAHDNDNLYRSVEHYCSDLPF